MSCSLRAAFALALALACSAAATHAHVTLEYGVAQAATTYKATFKVGHGCGESPTRQIVVELPAGVVKARPMPKPGWTLDVQPKTITWTAKTREDMLPDAHYDEFVLAARLADQPGTMFWPVRQVCETGRTDWIEIPKPGQKRSELKAPAAVLEVLPGGAAAHAH